MTDTARALKGDWVEIKEVILPPGQRAPQVPPDTQGVPLEMRVRGYLLQDAAVGNRARIRTLIGRHVEGILTQVRPRYPHDFGEVVPELLPIGEELWAFLKKAEAAARPEGGPAGKTEGAGPGV